MRSAATASARRSIPTIRSASGPRARAATSWCRSARPISASPTRSCNQIDKYVRNNTVNRFGPVREVTHEADKGLVIEVAFEGLQRSTRHKSGIAMRFPRISRLRWDKPPREADRLETLQNMLRTEDTATSVRPLARAASAAADS